jgi:hypothetical protein
MLEAVLHAVSILPLFLQDVSCLSSTRFKEWLKSHIVQTGFVCEGGFIGLRLSGMPPAFSGPAVYKSICVVGPNVLRLTCIGSNSHI